MHGHRVCLTMIVRNEAHVIARCLASVRPHIDAWLIVDTGSTDDTVAVVEAELAGIPGRVIHEPWVDFAHNRSVSLRAASGLADYMLVLDADEVLQVPDGFHWPTDMADVGLVHMHIRGTTFWLAKVFRASLPWRYEGVLHEYPACDEPFTSGRLPDVVVKGMFDSARNQRSAREKYLDDARVLEQALELEPDNARYVFYLAQSYRDAGEPAAARDAYQRRVDMAGWDEERWYALWQVAVLTERIGASVADVCDAYLAAYNLRPTRAEPLCDLARVNRVAGRHQVALVFAREAVRLPRPDDTLFLEDSVYDWRSADEYSLAAHFTGDHVTALEWAARALQCRTVPDEDRARITENVRWFTAGLTGQ